MYLEERLESLDKRLSSIEEKINLIILKLNPETSSDSEEYVKDNFLKFKDDWNNNAPNLEQLRGTLLTLRNALTGMTGSLPDEKQNIEENKETAP